MLLIIMNSTYFAFNCFFKFYYPITHPILRVSMSILITNAFFFRNIGNIILFLL